MFFNRWDVLSAFYMYSVLYNGGRYAADVAARLRKLEFRPAPSEEKIEGLSENAKAIFGRLVRSQEWRDVAIQRFIKRANGRLPGLGAPYREIAKRYPQALDS